MGFLSSPPPAPMPPPPPPPPAPPPPPTPMAPGVQKARKNTRRRAALAGGRKGTILTGPGGLSTTAQTTKKTLLGQ